jgi:hypothetical protein
MPGEDIPGRCRGLRAASEDGNTVAIQADKNQKDKSWTSNNEGYVLLREVSKTLWNLLNQTINGSPLLKLKIGINENDM